MFDYFTYDEADSLSFYRIPKTLIKAPEFKNLSTDAKLLYGLMLDRMGLSRKNHWVDKLGRVFIYYSQEEAQEDLNCGHGKIVNLYAELDMPIKDKGGIGLIERKKQGQGKPTIIYVKNCIIKGKFQTSEKRKSGSSINGSLDFSKTEILTSENRTHNNTEFNDTESSDSFIHSDNENEAKRNKKKIEFFKYYQDSLNAQMDYDEDAHSIYPDVYPFTPKQYEVLRNIMAEVMLMGDDETLRINKKDIPALLVKKQFERFTIETIGFVYSCLDKNTTDIKNMRQYLLTTMYRAPQLEDIQISSQVNHDFYGR